jgi:hypothetical protein
VAKILIHVAGLRCGRCGRSLGEDTEIGEKQRAKAKADSVYRPVYFCRSEGCPNRGKRVALEPVELDEMEPPSIA